VLHTVVHHDVGAPDLGGADVDHTATGQPSATPVALESTFYIRLKILSDFIVTCDPVTQALVFIRVVCSDILVRIRIRLLSSLILRMHIFHIFFL
jgi:hypothetical protein